MANFFLANNITAAHEGGFQNSPIDTGNYNSLGELVGTNWGINAQVYEAWVGFAPSYSDMYNMPLNIAKDIFKARFWDRIKGDQIDNQYVANIFYDGAVNHGVSLMSKFVQRIVGVNDDGVIGPISLNAINNYSPPERLYQEIKEKRIWFYYDIVSRHPSQQVFLQGWLNRMSQFEDLFFLDDDPTYPTTPTQIVGTGQTVFVAASIALLLWQLNKQIQS